MITPTVSHRSPEPDRRYTVRPIDRHRMAPAPRTLPGCLKRPSHIYSYFMTEKESSLIFSVVSLACIIKIVDNRNG